MTMPYIKVILVTSSIQNLVDSSRGIEEVSTKIYTKSTRHCFDAISNTLLTRVKVQIHTKDPTHTLCKDKQEPH